MFSIKRESYREDFKLKVILKAKYLEIEKRQDYLALVIKVFVKAEREKKSWRKWTNKSVPCIIETSFDQNWKKNLCHCLKYNEKQEILFQLLRSGLKQKRMAVEIRILDFKGGRNCCYHFM